MIESIDLQKLRNGEYSQLMQDVLAITGKNDPAAMKVEVPFGALQATATEVETLFKQPTGSAITTELENFDLLRDNALKGIQSIVRGNTYSEDAAVKNHAQVLDTHLALFGSNITGDSYQSETSSIRNIIADWNAKPELTAAITALGLQNWQKAMENANNSFGDKYLLRAVELGTDVADSLKAKRLQANTAYYTLRDNINAYYTITNGSEPYKTVVASINGLLSFYNDVLSRRTGGNGEGEVDTPAVDKPVQPVV